ncbi:hypothetical protein Gasu2_45110 [Galdieria sulphuraria]|nr:hypothetical protein Gasu2_45110 [Galdieria sulphuraria]
MYSDGFATHKRILRIPVFKRAKSKKLFDMSFCENQRAMQVVAILKLVCLHKGLKDVLRATTFMENYENLVISLC